MKKRGFVLVLVLMLCMLLFTMGFSFLSTLVTRYQSTAQSVLELQAEGIARAGIEEVRVKMNLDFRFPPPAAVNQAVFSYSELVKDAAGNPFGQYDISMDTSYLGTGCEVLILTSTGKLFSPVDSKKVLARRSLRVFLDVFQPEAGPVNPTYWTILRFDDLGSQ